MAKAHDILGMNARQKLYVRHNTKQAKRYAESKLAPKKLFMKVGIPAPKVYAVFSSMDEVQDFVWEELDSSFVIKPVGGNAGNGILIIKKPGKYAGDWFTIDNQKITTQDLRLHVSNILEGQFSTYGIQHNAFVEERVLVHPKLRNYVFRGTPDIRIIVYNSVPVMAMLRLPTRQSNGRANLHQGAVGVGVDIASGITIQGILNGKPVTKILGKNENNPRKVNGIRLPEWKKLLITAVRAAEATGLAYAGVDLFIDPEKGPMVVEMNSNPGLSIQLANGGGLRKRLERVEGLKIRDVEHGVRVGRALFAEWFADETMAEDGVVVVDTFEKVGVRASDKKWVQTDAKIDTGAFRTAIDKELAKNLGLMRKDNVLWEGRFRSSYGRQRRPVIDLIIKVKGKKLRTAASVVDRKKLRIKVLIGRRDLQGFLVQPQLRKE